MTSSQSNNTLNAVSIFTGAGGLDIGFERAGFRTISALVGWFVGWLIFILVWILLLGGSAFLMSRFGG